MQMKSVFKIFVPSNQYADDRSSQIYQNIANKNFLLVDPTVYDNHYEMMLFFCTRITKEVCCIAKYIHIYLHFLASSLF